MENTYQSKHRVEELRGRAKRCRCKYCGGPLEVRRIVFSDYEDARIEIFCVDCDRIEYGVEPEIYKSAEYFVEELEFNCYPQLDDNEKTRQMNISKVCEIMTWATKNLGFLERDGFTVPVIPNQEILGETIIIEGELLTPEN